MTARLLALLLAGLLASAAPGPARAEAPSSPAAIPEETAARALALAEALRFPELAAIMLEEGLAHAEGIEEELFPGAGGPRWRAEAARIYAPARISGLFVAALAEAMAEDGGDFAPALDFFTSPLGARIVTLEVEARRALLDDATEAMSRDLVEAMEAEGAPRLALVRRFIAVNDLVELNVEGGLNAHYAFYAGLAEGGAFEGGITEEEIVADVWAQEEALREDNIRWLESYLVLAYEPLSDAELEAYVAFSETEAGRRLNRAIFAAFGRIYSGVSRELGLAAAGFIRAQEL